MEPVKIVLVDCGFDGRCLHTPLIAAAGVLEAVRVSIDRRTTVRPGAER